MIYVASDHIGISLKQLAIDYLTRHDQQVKDLGPNSTKRVNYTDFAKILCAQMLKNEGSQGILICGTGIGMSMMANRYKGIRAAVCTHEYMAEMTRKHNNANVLCLGSRVIGDDLTVAIVEKFFMTSFEGGRHAKRVEQFDY